MREPALHITRIILLLLLPLLSLTQVKNPKELVKIADQYFEQGNYKEAMPLYSQLVANFPKDPNYNYKYGACLIYGDQDKSKALTYLDFAVGRPEVEPEAFFFLGKAYHLNYSFAKAAKNYERFKSLAKSKTIAKYDVDGHLRQAKNGQSLLRNITDIIVLDKQKLKDQDYFKVYDLSDFGGKLVLKPDEFKTAYEKTEGIESVLYLPPNATRIYFSSLESEESNRDLYYAERTDKGWSAKKKLPSSINTEFDEDFAFMHPEANVLYFSSKGHNSLGGFDIFKSTFDAASGTWSKPENLDFAINTPDDDFLFITDKDQKSAYFSSKRSSVQGEVHVYRINMQRVPMDIAVVSGIFEANTTKSASIQVKDMDRNVLIGSFETDPQTGKYLIELPQTGNYQFLVDYKGSTLAHAGEVSLKNQNPFKPLLQEMKIEKQGTVDEKLIIRNLVDVEVAEDDPIIAEIFKQRAQLNVTSAEKIEAAEKAQPLAEAPKVAVSEKAKPTVIPEAQAEVNSTASTEAAQITSTQSDADDAKFQLSGDDFTKEDIARVSMNNAMSLEKDAKILEKEAEIAATVAAQKREKAAQKRNEVKLAVSKLDTTVQTSATTQELQRIRYIERQANDLEQEVRVSDELAEDLKDRAYQKKSAQAIATSYANQIQNSIDQNNKQASLDKLKQLQDYVEEQKQEKSSINTMGEKLEAELTQKRAILRNQKRYQKQLEDQLFAKEKRYMEMNPDPENPDEAAKQFAEELKRDRLNLDGVKARTVRSQEEVETLRSEIQVIKEIADDVNNSDEIAALASETPDKQVVPLTIEVPDISEDLKEASESDLGENADEVIAENSASNTESASAEKPVEPAPEVSKVKGSKPAFARVNEEHTDYSKPSGGRFHPDNVNAQLQDPNNQSLAVVMRSGYNNAYQNDFMNVAEEQDELTRNVKMKVLNEDWVSDIEAEYDYLDSLEKVNTNPEFVESVEIRKASLKKLKTIKKQELENIDAKLTALAAEQNKDLEEIVQQVREGKAIAKAKQAEQIADQAKPQATAASTQNTLNTEAEAANGTAQTSALNKPVENTNQSSDQAQNPADGAVQSEVTANNDTSKEAENTAEAAANTQDNQNAADSGGNDSEANEAPLNDERLKAASEKSSLQVETKSAQDATAFADDSQSEPEQELVQNPEQIQDLIDKGDEQEIVARVKPSERFIASEASEERVNEALNPVKKITQERLSDKKREINDTQDAIGTLETTIANTKKKKKRRPLEEDLKNKQEELRMLEAQRQQIEKESDAVVNLAAFEVSGQGAENTLSPRDIASLNAQDLEKMALDTAQYASDLRNLAANTKKKKEKQRLLKQAEVYDERAKKLSEEAERSKALAAELEPVETKLAVIKENIKLELPMVNQELSPDQEASIVNSPEFIKYSTEVSEADRKIKRAEVLYDQAQQKALASNVKEAEATELEAQLPNISDPVEKTKAETRAKDLRREVAQMRSEALQQKQEAHQLAIEGNKQRNNATSQVLQLDASQRDAIAAVQSKKGATGSTKTSFSPDEFSAIVEGKMEIPDVLTTAIYKKVAFNESLYSSENPIPVNSKVPKGLIYMVQVGAFRLPISQDVFKGFAPVRGEGTANGLTRYMAGLFKQINQANLARNEIRAIGYRDAFVVAYFNGERITLSRARELEGAGPAMTDQGQIAAANVPSNIPAGANPPAQVFSAEELKGLFYTVQVGAFSREVPPSTLYNLSPLVKRQVSGLVKYTCGIYSSKDEANASKDRIREIGIKDAFVTIFYNGEPVSEERANQILQEQGNSAFEQDVPVSTASGGGNAAAGGVEYQVQVGAYAEEVPVEDAQIILGLSNLGLEVKADGGMTKYVVGGYKTYKEADDFRKKIQAQGLSSAFIVAYENGQKIDIQRAKELSGD